MRCGYPAYVRPFIHMECNPRSCPVRFKRDPKEPGKHCYYLAENYALLSNKKGTFEPTRASKFWPRRYSERIALTIGEIIERPALDCEMSDLSVWMANYVKIEDLVSLEVDSKRFLAEMNLL